MTREEAKAAGAKRFIGNPCRKGHDGTRYVLSYDCCQCARERVWKHRGSQRRYSPLTGDFGSVDARESLAVLDQKLAKVKRNVTIGVREALRLRCALESSIEPEHKIIPPFKHGPLPAPRMGKLA